MEARKESGSESYSVQGNLVTHTVHGTYGPLTSVFYTDTPWAYQQGQAGTGARS